jgi:uncharacterized protein (TIGR03435 family)
MTKPSLLVSVGIVAIAGAMSGVVLPAQTPPAPAFEVASIKPDKSGELSESVNLTPGGEFTATHFTLQLLIGMAYGTGGPLPSYRMAGGPGWIGTDRFDIIAKMPSAGGTPAESFVMLRTLLAERFRLVAHHESRELPIFALVTDGPPGRLGPKLHATTRDCTAAANGAPPTATTSDGAPVCFMRFGPGRILGGNQTIPTLALTLSRYVLRSVVDRTELGGRFDVALEWTPSPGEGLQTTVAASAPPRGPDDGPSLVTAVKEQLGLKLEAARGPVDVLVIDHAEHPTEN